MLRWFFRVVFLVVCALPSFTTSAQTLIKTAGSWRVIERVDRMHDVKSLLAVNLTKEAVDRDAPHALTMYCSPSGSLIVSVMTHGYWGSSHKYFSLVTYRVDKGNAVQTKWNSVTGGKIVWTENQELVELMRKGLSILIRVMDYKYRGHEAAFALDGIEDVIDVVGQSCRK